MKLNADYYDNDSSELVTIGHQEGLFDLVSAESGKYYNDKELRSHIFFSSNLDINSGSSGSPVINKDTGHVVGIIASTIHETEDNFDYVYNNEKDCYEDKVYSHGELTTRATRINIALNDSIDHDFQDLVFNGRFEATANPVTIQSFYNMHSPNLHSIYAETENGVYTLMSVAVLRYMMTGQLDSLNYLTALNVKVDYLSYVLAYSLVDSGQDGAFKVFEDNKHLYDFEL